MMLGQCARRVSFAAMLLAILPFVTSPATAEAQSGQTSALTGTVTDTSHAVVPRATVTITSPSLIGGAQTTATDVDGTYRFPALLPGVYRIAAHLDGFRTLERDDVRLPAGATITIDFQLPVASVTDVLTVRGRSPMVDVKSAASPTRLDQEMLHNLPASRSIAELINLTPGVAENVSFGGSQNSNALYVDGVSMTEPQLQDPLTRFNYNWVQEVQVVALGANAEYGNFTGVSANSVLRSGANRFSGLGEYWTTRPSWMDSNTTSLEDKLRKQFKPREIVAYWDSSVQLGGPILRDRLWFFSGFQYSRHDDRPAGFTGPGSRDERDRQFLVKLNAALSSSVRAEGFYERGVDSATGDGIDRFTPIEASNDYRQPQHSWNAKLSWVRDPRTLLEVRYSGYLSPQAYEPHPPNTRSGPAPHYDVVTDMNSVNASSYFRNENTQYSVSAGVTHYTDRFLGRSHEFKFGIEYEHSRSRQEYGYPGGRSYFDYAGEPYLMDSWAGEAGNARTNRASMYARDSWAVNDRLTIQPGIRLDMNRGSVPIKGQIFSTDPVSPRIGLAWDLRGDHKTVLRAHAGRYHDALFSSRIMFGDRSEVSPYISYEFDGSRFVETFRDDGGPDTYAIDKNLKHSHVDQYVVGIERELFEDFSVQFQYIRRNFNDFMGLIDTGTIYEQAQRRDPGPDGKLGTSDDGGLVTVYNATNPGNRFRVYTNPPDAFNRYNAVQVVARKRYSRDWQMQASYTWSRAEGTVGNRWHVNAARFDLGDPGTFVDPNRRYINAFGRGPYDPTHEWKLLGTYRVPFWGGVNVSSVYRYHTGMAWGRIFRPSGLRQGGRSYVRVEPQGTRRTDATNTIDLRVEKTFVRAVAGQTVGLFFDASNLNNQGIAANSGGCCGTGVQQLSGPSFGEPAGWTDPRTLRVGLRFLF